MALASRKATLEHHRDAPRREDGRDLLEVHVAGVCVRPRGDAWEVLVAKRSDDRSLYPGKWECGGGQVLEGDEGFEGAIKRKIFEEFGIDIEVDHVLETYQIPRRGKQRIIPGVRYLCVAGRSVRIQLNKRQFSTYRWVRFPVPSLNFIEGVKKVLDILAAELSNPNASQRKPPKRSAA